MATKRYDPKLPEDLPEPGPVEITPTEAAKVLEETRGPTDEEVSKVVAGISGAIRDARSNSALLEGVIHAIAAIPAVASRARKILEAIT